MFFSIFTIYQGTKCRRINWWKTLCNFKQARPALGGPVRSTSQRSERVNATNFIPSLVEGRSICFEKITYFTKSLKKILQLTSQAMFFSILTVFFRASKACEVKTDEKPYVILSKPARIVEGKIAKAAESGGASRSEAREWMIWKRATVIKTLLIEEGLLL